MKRFITKVAIFGVALSMLLSACGGGNSKSGNNAASGSNGEYTIQYNFSEGDSYRLDMVMDMKVSQQGMEMGTTMDMKTHSDITKVDGDLYTMEMMYDEIKMSATGLMQMSFDSNTPDTIATIENMSPLFKALIGKPLEIIIDKNGKVQSISGSEKLTEAMRNSLDESIDESTRNMMMAQIGQQFNDESLKSMMEQSAGYFPGKPVKVGDSWSSIVNVQSVKVDMTMTLKSVENDVATIEGAGEISATEGAVTLEGNQKAVIKVNMKTGWIISSEMNQVMNGSGAEVVNKITITGNN